MESRASPELSGNVATVVIHTKVRDGREDDYRRWQEKVNDIARGFDGFEDTEMHPPVPGEENVWVIVYRFSNIDQLTAWLNSRSRQELLDEGRSLFDGPAKQEVLAGEAPARDVVTAVIPHEVRPGREQDFVGWQNKVRKAQEKFPGFMGFELFRPVSNIQEKWVAVVRFDTREHLDEWLESDARRRLVKEGRDYFSSYDVRKVSSAFSGWFRFGNETEEGTPPNWKQAMTVVLALYPTVMILNLTVGKIFGAAKIPGYIALFISNLLSVSILTWLLMPLVNRALSFWLLPSRADSITAQVTGTVVVVLCFLLFIAIFGVITS
ncbi:MAG: putative rane protein [Actinomycetia bacterium]|nr:putative rane protein [Actinomycetes bacterium]